MTNYSYSPNYSVPYNYNNYNNYSVNNQPMTNKIYVTSVEDALARYANPNTTMVYYLQDESQLFEVTTDIQGKKGVKIRKIVDCVPEPPPSKDYITRDEFTELQNKVKELFKDKE